MPYNVTRKRQLADHYFFVKLLLPKFEVASLTVKDGIKNFRTLKKDQL